MSGLYLYRPSARVGSDDNMYGQPPRGKKSIKSQLRDLAAPPPPKCKVASHASSELDFFGLAVRSLSTLHSRAGGGVSMRVDTFFHGVAGLVH